MCLGIPCVGMRVRMRDSYTAAAGVRIPSGTRGTVVEEIRPSRAIKVNWQLGAGIVEAIVPANLVEIIERPPPGSTSGQSGGGKENPPPAIGI